MKLKRNDPCFCGSGKKYKKCCGAVEPVSKNIVQNKNTFAASDIIVKKNSETRVCGSCSLCCDGWLKTRVLDVDIELGQPCPHSTGQQCGIHNQRPEDPCRIFFCGWAKSESLFPDWMHPKQCGVIVLTGRSKWRGREVDVLVSAGKDPDERMLNWFKGYSQKLYHPFIYQDNGLWYGYGPPAFQMETANKVKKGLPLWT